MSPEIEALWKFLPYGYVLTILIEIPILLLFLSTHHSYKTRLIAGFWLTACTYPMVVLVFPLTIWSYFGRTNYLIVAETFAPTAECLLFWLAYGKDPQSTKRSTIQDFCTITAANLVSFLTGILLRLDQYL